MAYSSQAKYMQKLKPVERDPTGRYVRYNDFLGEGHYRGFDEFDGIEVAWSKTRLSDQIVQSPITRDGLIQEANMLMSLSHENILRCYYAWIEGKDFIMITEICPSENLTEYCKNHNLEDIKSIKYYARQILRGLDYLHRHSPPIIHRDIRCENIFVNEETGIVKFRDLGLAKFLTKGSPKSLVGTPAFWAPEMLKGTYNQLVDIYCFGMSLLQLFTGEVPYSECICKTDLELMVRTSLMPAAYRNLKNPEVKTFIQRCIRDQVVRPAAIELLNYPFLALSDSETSTAGDNLNQSDSLGASAPGAAGQMASLPAAPPVEQVMEIISDEKLYQLYGKFTDNDLGGFMILRILEYEAHFISIKVPFNLETDTIESLIMEMMIVFDLSGEDGATVSRLMEDLLIELVAANNEYKSKLGNETSEQPIDAEHLDPQQIPGTTGGAEHRDPQQIPPTSGGHGRQGGSHEQG